MEPQRIAFINDVWFCASGVLRLLRHDADMACGMDFFTLDGKLSFYDTWVARDADGKLVDNNPPYTEYDILRLFRLICGHYIT